MPTLELARAHYAARRKLINGAVAEGNRLWATVDTANLRESWLAALTRMFVVVSGAQLAAARQAEAYTAAALAAQGVDTEPAGQVVADALAGVASDGWPLDSLLLAPMIAAKKAVLQRATLDRALAAGQATLEMTVRTQVADAGRVADGVAVAVRTKTTWTRMVVGDSCPRCIILAGRVYRYSDGFERHPNCDCVHIPTAENTAHDYTTDPKSAFAEGRIKGLSKSDEQAIRDGADMAQVVNAHSGMYVAGTRKFTRSGTTRHGFAGSRLRGAARLMPEQIYRESSSREEAVRLLKRHGYMV